MQRNYPGGAAEAGAQMAWLRAELAKPARWKLVVGHFPLFSMMGNGPTRELVEAVLPLLIEHGVQAYLSGHDHALQHIVLRDLPFGPQFVVSGAGGYTLHTSLKPEADGAVNAPAEAKFAAGKHGFVTAAVTADALILEWIDAESGAVLHSATLAPNL